MTATNVCRCRRRKPNGRKKMANGKPIATSNNLRRVLNPRCTADEDLLDEEVVIVSVTGTVVVEAVKVTVVGLKLQLL